MNVTDRDPDETKDIRLLIAEVIDQPEEWLDRPHALLGAWTPRELIGTDREEFVRNLIRSLKLGMPT